MNTTSKYYSLLFANGTMAANPGGIKVRTGMTLKEAENEINSYRKIFRNSKNRRYTVLKEGRYYISMNNGSGNRVYYIADDRGNIPSEA